MTPFGSGDPRDFQRHLGCLEDGLVGPAGCGVDKAFPQAETCALAKSTDVSVFLRQAGVKPDRREKRGRATPTGVNVILLEQSTLNNAKRRCWAATLWPGNIYILHFLIIQSRLHSFDESLIAEIGRNFRGQYMAIDRGQKAERSRLLLAF